MVKKMLLMLLLHVMTMLTKLFCVPAASSSRSERKDFLTDVKEDASNVTLACDDDAQNVVLPSASPSRSNLSKFKSRDFEKPQGFENKGFWKNYRVLEKLSVSRGASLSISGHDTQSVSQEVYH